MNILVTGASGFLGYNLTRRLISEGHNVIAVGVAGENIIHQIPIISPDYDFKKLSQQDAVFHLGANNDTLSTDEADMISSNVDWTARLFTDLASVGCKKFIYASSTAVYGNEKAPYIESETPVKPLNMYGISKAKMEKFASEFSTVHNIQTVGFRYCNVYGPHENHKGRRMSMIGQMIRSMMTGKQIRLFEFGHQRRDWVYVDDVVSANMLAIENPRSGIYNIGSGVNISFNELFYIIKNALRNEIAEIEYFPNPLAESYQDFTQCDISKATHHLGYYPKFSISDGIRSYIEQLEAEVQATDP